jgi:short-subunit dehydrogenase
MMSQSGSKPLRAVVVGASSGIGAALVQRLAGEGAHVAALARRAEELEALRAAAESSEGEVSVYVHDVCDTEAVGALFEEVLRDLGGLDLMIYAAGIMSAVGRDEYNTELDLAMLNVNVAGCAAWCNPTANLFRTQRSGTIVGISSIAGARGRKGNPMYGTTKAAMDHYLEALRNRLSECGAHVCTIKPGFVATPMTEGVEGMFWVISADTAAKRILRAARCRVNERYVPMRWGLVALVLRCIPSFLFKRLNF